MASFADDLLTVDRGRINLRAGLLGLTVVAALGAAVAAWGPVFIAAAFGALMLLTTDPPNSGRGWAVSLPPLIVVGTTATFLAVLIGARPLLAALLAGIVGVAAAMQAGESRKAGIRGLIGTIWVVLALTLGETPVRPVNYALMFAGGALVGAAVIWLRSRTASNEAGDESTVEELTTTTRQRVQFAVLRGLGLAVAVLLGFSLFPSHPAWVAISSLIVMRPPTHQALIIGVQRSLGTGVGVLITVVLAGVVGENRPVLITLFLASAFLAMAFREANYALFAVFVTALVVYSQRILGADAGESGQSRFIETVLGVAIAFGVLGIAEALARREH